jgi:hypothetical protein
MLDSIIGIIARSCFSLCSLCIGNEVCDENSMIVNNDCIENNVIFYENQTFDMKEYTDTNRMRNQQIIECKRVVDAYSQYIKEQKYRKEALENYVDVNFEMEQWRKENPKLVKKCIQFAKYMSQHNERITVSPKKYTSLP